VDYRKGPFVIRYPRSSCSMSDEDPPALRVGTWDVLHEGVRFAIIATGSMVAQAQNALPLLKRRGLNPTLVNARFIKPLDCVLLNQFVRRLRTIITVEENACHGGFGSSVFQYFCKQNAKVKVHCIGLPDNFVEHGARSMLLKTVHLDAEGLAKSIASIL